MDWVHLLADNSTSVGAFEAFSAAVAARLELGDRPFEVQVAEGMGPRLAFRLRVAEPVSGLGEARWLGLRAQGTELDTKHYLPWESLPPGARPPLPSWLPAALRPVMVARVCGGLEVYFRDGQGVGVERLLTLAAELSGGVPPRCPWRVPSIPAAVGLSVRLGAGALSPTVYLFEAGLPRPEVVSAGLQTLLAEAVYGRVIRLGRAFEAAGVPVARPFLGVAWAGPRLQPVAFLRTPAPSVRRA